MEEKQILSCTWHEEGEFLVSRKLINFLII